MSRTISTKILLACGCMFFVASSLSIAILYRNVGAALLAAGFIFVALFAITNKIRSITVVFSSFAFALAIAEFALYSKPKVYHDPSSGYRRDYGRQTDIGSQANPGIHTSRLVTSDGEVIYDVIYSIGEDGFRVTPQSISKSKHVNFFGCSFTFGEGLNDNQTLPFYFEQILDSYSSKNFGFHGYGAHQALAILQSDRRTKGDINFFLTSPWHSLRSACKPAYTAGSPRYALVGEQISYVGKCREGDLSLMRKIIQQANVFNLYEQTKNISVATDDDFALYLAIVEKIYIISKERGQQFIVGFISAEENFFDGTSYSNKRIFDSLKERADQLIDLTLADSTETLPREYYIHPLDKHPSAAANKERARILALLINP